MYCSKICHDNSWVWRLCCRAFSNVSSFVRFLEQYSVQWKEWSIPDTKIQFLPLFQRLLYYYYTRYLSHIFFGIVISNFYDSLTINNRKQTISKLRRPQSQKNTTKLKGVLVSEIVYLFLAVPKITNLHFLCFPKITNNVKFRLRNFMFFDVLHSNMKSVWFYHVRISYIMLVYIISKSTTY